MPKDLQEIFTSSANNALKFYATEQGKEVDESVEILLKAKKVQVVPMDPAEEKRWREATNDVIVKKYNAQVARVGGDGTTLLASYTALVRKYEKEYPYVTGIDRFVARKK
jgi:hypothetical protein